jgi:hypothetical protein
MGRVQNNFFFQIFFISLKLAINFLKNPSIFSLRIEKLLHEKSINRFAGRYDRFWKSEEEDITDFGNLSYL